MHSGFSAPNLPGSASRVAGVPLQPLGRILLPPAINHALARHAEDGLLDFLADRVIGIVVSDLDVAWHFTFDARCRRIRATRAVPHAVIRGDACALVLLAAQRADPDTLFFRRRLVLEGDTELGLQAKNLLDTLEDDDLPPPLARFLDHAGWVAERWS